MKAGRKKQNLTEREAEIMNMLWDNGPMFIREMVDKYPDPKPHFNTISTIVRILEGKGHVKHEQVGGWHRFSAVSQPSDFREKSMAEVVRNFFGNSYKSAVSALAEEEKISLDELKEIVAFIEEKNKK